MEPLTNDMIAENLFILIPMLRDCLIKPFENALKNTLSPMQFYTLLALRENKSMTMTELAQYLGIPKQQMTKIINKLVDLEMVVRKYDTADRRTVKIYIHPDGFSCICKYRSEICAAINSHICTLTAEDKQALYRAVETIKDILPRINMKQQE